MRNFHQTADWFSGEKAFATLSYGWLWAGLYFILVITITITFVFCQCFERHCFHKTSQVIIVGVTSLFGYIEVITSTLVSIKPSYARCLLQTLQRVYKIQFHPKQSELIYPSIIIISPQVQAPDCLFCAGRPLPPWSCSRYTGLLSFIWFVDFAEIVFFFREEST